MLRERSILDASRAQASNMAPTNCISPQTRTLFFTTLPYLANKVRKTHRGSFAHLANFPSKSRYSRRRRSARFPFSFRNLRAFLGASDYAEHPVGAPLLAAEIPMCVRGSALKR